MRNIRVLVIDDETDVVKGQIQRLASYLPQDVSLQPSFATSVADGRAELLDREHLDLVLLDIGNVDPKRDAITRIRDLHPYVPVVMYSKHNDAETILEYLDLGARTYIPKGHLPPEVLSESTPRREESVKNAAAIVRRLLRAATEYLPVKRLIARALENGVVRKSGPRKDLEDQIAFLEEVQSINELAPFFPPVRSREIMEFAAYYEMPCYEMVDLYKFLLGESFRETCENIAKGTISIVIGGPFLQLARRQRQTGLTADIVPALFFDRFRGRVKEASEKLRALGSAAEPAAWEFGRLLESPAITIGGVCHKNPAAVIKVIESDRQLCERLTPPFLSRVHGDLHFKNILIDDRLPKLLRVKLVDPRGARVGTHPHGVGDPAYDLGKLLYSSRALSHLVQDDIYRPAHGTLRFEANGDASAGAFERFENERAAVPGGLSASRLSAYRPTVQPWIWDVFAGLGEYLKESVDSCGYAEHDPDWYIRACLYESLHCCSLAPMLLDRSPAVASNLFLRGTELLSQFWATFNPRGGTAR